MRSSDADNDSGVILSGDEVRKAIIESAVELFEKRGYSNVKISDIASNVGMTTGAFYYYFRSKTEILEIVSNYFISRAAETVKAIYEREDLDTKQKLALMLREHCLGVARYHSHVSVFYREIRNLTPDALTQAVEFNRQFLHYTTAVIESGAKEGIFRPELAPKVVALGLIGMCNWLHQWYSPDGSQTIEEITEIFTRLISGGLTTDHRDFDAFDLEK